MANPEDKLIMIVDDDETVVELLKFAVENAGFNSMSAINSYKALELVQAHKPDLIILDMRLPGKTGFEVLGILAKNNYGDIPVILISGSFTDEILRDISNTKNNIKGYFAKPINTVKLVEDIHTLLV